jgi:hypothetical protein
MKLFNKLKGMFKQKDKTRRKNVVHARQNMNKQKPSIENINDSFRNNHDLSELTRQRINKRRKKKKMAKASKKRNRK